MVLGVVLVVCSLVMKGYDHITYSEVSNYILSNFLFRLAPAVRKAKSRLTELMRVLRDKSQPDKATGQKKIPFIKECSPMFARSLSELFELWFSQFASQWETLPGISALGRALIWSVLLLHFEKLAFKYHDQELR